MTSAVWITIGALCVGTFATKAIGPLSTGGRRPPARLLAVFALAAPVIVTALVVDQTFTAHPYGITLDARLVGVGVAGVAIVSRVPMLAVVVLAATATALARALT